MRRLVLTAIIVGIITGCALLGGEKYPDDLVFVNEDQEWFADQGYADIWTIDNEARHATATIRDHKDWFWAVMRDQFSDFDLRFEFSKTDGSLKDVVTIYAHVLDRARTGNSENEYFINFGLESGSYLVAYVDESNSWHYISDPNGNGWVPTTEIKTGLDQWNSVRLVRFDSTFYLYINGTKMGEFRDSSRTHGYLALGGGHWDSAYDGTTTVRFRNWSCSELSGLPGDL